MGEQEKKMWGEREKFPAYFDKLEDARNFVRSFWAEVFDTEHYPEIKQILELPDAELDQQLTYFAHRTQIRRAIVPVEKNKGNFIAFVSGNHQPLLVAADVWLKNKGY